MTESDALYVSKFYLSPGRSGYMTGDDLSEEKKKLVKMITMIDNAVAMREAAPKTAILQIIETKIEKMEGLKKKLEVASDSQEGFFVDVPPTQQQQQTSSSSSSSSASLFTRVTMSPTTAAVSSSEHYTPAGMATTATEAFAVRMALVEEEKEN
jgi:hypothetical protein